MTESEWLTSTDPAAMLTHLQRHHQPTERKLRALAGACTGEDLIDDVAKFDDDFAGLMNAVWRVFSQPHLFVPALRDIFNPFRQTPNWKRCVPDESEAMGGNKTVDGHPDRTVFTLAQTIYDHHDWSAMPALHDALVDAGCDNEELLTHLLEREHWRGCWVIDLILGKE